MQVDACLSRCLRPDFARCGQLAIMQRSGYVAIVDDDAALREALARLLRIQGINSRSYPSALVFLEGLASGMPDCLIADVNMPEMTGIELPNKFVRN